MAGTRPPCLVCDGAEGKYKCTRCHLYTCSLPCFREHRDSHPPVESCRASQSGDEAPASMSDVSSNDVSQISSQADGNNTPRSASAGSGIADMPEYRALKRKYPNLERLLWNIAAATDPPTSDGASNGKHGAPHGHGKGHRKATQPWTKDMGYENGIEVLRQARDAPGSDRDALREYCELVRIYSARRESAEMAANLRQQLALDDAKTIADLLRAEKSNA